MSRDSESLGSKRQSRMQAASWTIGIIVVAAIFLILAKAVSKPSTNNTKNSGDGLASSSLIGKLTSLPQSLVDGIGQGTANPLPLPAKGAPALTKDGKPQIFYAGAEYCPYCAAERWPMVLALLRFGTFSNLGTSHSSTTDVFANTQTFSFHGATYTSQYLSLDAIETQSNQIQGTAYASLDKPTAAQQALITTYDAPPYVPKASSGSIPFIYFGGKFIISGSTYSPGVLQNKSLDDIAAALSDQNSDVAKGIVGSANAITAAICSLTNNQPADACSSSMIQALEAKLTAQ